MSNNLCFSLPDKNTIPFNILNVYVLGNAGRTEEVNRNHIIELEKEGVPAPINTEVTINLASDYLITQDESIQVLGNKTTGEIEYVLLVNNKGTFVTLGSDHADRVLEAQRSPFFKQICQKPIAKDIWPIEEVIGHWDEICLTCEIYVDGNWEIYQNGKVVTLLEPYKVVDILHKNNVYSNDGMIVYCGTVYLGQGKFRYAETYRMTMHDPVLNRSIVHCYNVEMLNKK